MLEANPNLIKWLETNKDENNCDFAIENSIISKNDNTIFHINKNIHSSSTKHESAKKINVRGIDIEGLEKKYDINFDTLVLDIEGGELDLFRNHMDRINKFENNFFELHDFNSKILTKEEGQECERLLEQNGFNQIIKTWCYQIWQKAA